MTAFRRAPALFLTLAGTALAAPALAGTGLSIPLAPAAETNIIMTQYSCDGGAPFDMQYVNADENNLALIPVAGSERVFVQVVSASGVRADLSDLLVERLRRVQLRPAGSLLVRQGCRQVLML